MKSKHAIRKIASLFFAIVLAAEYIIPSAQLETFALQDTNWYDSIPKMLSAGEYEEGVVVAGIDMTKARKQGDPGSALDSKKLGSGAEEIIRIEGDEDGSQQEFVSWFRQLNDFLFGQSDDSMCITSIRREGMTTEQILRLLASDDSVIFAEPNYIMDVQEEGNADISSDEPEADEIPAAGSAGGTDGDATGLQWSSSEDSTYHANSKIDDVSMKVPGWPYGKNMDHEVIVAVLDMPVDFSNPDLKDRAYTFTPQLQRELGCDEHGYNAMWTSEDGKLDNPVKAVHGTHVAGIIGASWNDEGISGVGSNVKIISVQNGDERNTSLIDDLRGYSFIKKAVEAGVDIRIINNSWSLGQSSKAMAAAITELGEMGVISIFAAGNSSQDLNSFPNIMSLLADNPYYVMVASTSPTGEMADSSCYSKDLVTLGAPGASILSTVPQNLGSYLPFLAEENKLYEDFEDSDKVSVKVSQLAYIERPNKWGGTDYEPNPDEAVQEAEVVSGSSEMGFEGSKVLKLEFDPSEIGGASGGNVAIRLDINVSELEVANGNVLGFAYGANQELEPIYTKAIDGEPTHVLFEKNNRNCWNTFNCTIEDGIEDGTLTLIMEFVTNGADGIYLDTFGITEEQNAKQPYGFLSGTSMAAPAVSGAAAVIASRHYNELNDLKNSNPASSAKRLATLVRSSVRPLASLKDMTSTGGTIDLTVDTRGIDPDADQPGPDITDITVSGNKVTLTGAGFGNTPGTAEVRKYVAAKRSTVGTSIASWSDGEVVLTLDKDFEGIIEVVLTHANGEKKDTILKYVSKSSNIFEKDLNFPSDTGDTYAFDEDDSERMGDYETSGIMAAGDGNLYYLPQIAKVEECPVFRSMFCYNPDKDSWKTCPALPVWLRDASCVWLDGKLYVKGTSVNVDDSGTVPYYDEYDDGTPYIYSFDPNTQKWTECSNSGVAPEYTLLTDGTKLMLAGVSYEEEDEYFLQNYPVVRDYDTAAGAGGNVIFSSNCIKNPKVAYAGGYIYFLDFLIGNTLYAINENTPPDDPVYIELPEFYFGSAPERRDEEYNVLEKTDVVMLAYEDMLILTGPAAKDGSSDTFILKAGETKLTPLGKRISDAEVILPCAAVMDGRLYVIGASYVEPDRRVFRSTLLKTYTVTYDLNGGSYDGSTQNITEEYEKGTVIQIHEAPTREGYVFSYWKGSEYQPGDSYTVTEDHTFVAQWEKEEAASDDGSDTGNKSGNGVRTGDESQLSFWMAVALLAALGVTVMLLIRHRRRAE